MQVLEGALIDQIAAGEVVERPASVVKELLENALDAGARAITVEIERGGVGLVRVTDDGEGMTPEDAALAVERHATSKIRRLEDLSAIRTLGFRGEALPSIASVSRFSLTTRTVDAVAGTRVRLLHGEDKEVSAIGCAKGTTIEVRELFETIPARRKFLKREATEGTHVADVCLRTALARPELRLVLLRDGKRSREFLPAADRIDRAREVFVGEKLVPLSGERDGISVLAVLAAPERARTGAAALHLYVNDRPVRDRALARAVAFAYGSVLPPGRFPIGVVYVDLDPAEVDVNAHPQKAEVRFARPREVLDAITRSLAAKLGTAAFGGPSARGPGFWNERLGLAPSTHRSATVDAVEEATATVDASDPWGLVGLLTGTASGSMPAGEPPSSRPYDASPPPLTRIAEAVPSLLEPRGRFGAMRVLGQVRKTFLVCEDEEGLHVLDQHAADERVRFHRLRRSYAANEVALQRLLFPDRVECTEAEAQFVEDSAEELARLGIECSLVGATTVAVRAIPALVRRAAPERLLRDLLDELMGRGERAFGDAVDMALATMACHGAIRAGDPLSPQESAELLRTLDEIDDFAGHCPHGRPVVFSIGFGDLEKRLGR